MITKQNAIEVGRAVIAGMVRECDNCQARDHVQAIGQRAHRYHIRGAALYALDNLWYDVFQSKVREQFGHDRMNFFTACGWPE